jgi:hypothetical protein
MATERTNEWQQMVPTIPFIAPAWRQVAIEQRLIQARARLQMQLAIASRMHDYLSQFQQRTAERLAGLEGQLTKYEASPESTPQSGSQQTMVLGLIRELAREGPVSTEKLNKALEDRGKPSLPRGMAQGAINQFYLSNR